MSDYNINRKNVALIGHSLGGSGVYYVAAANQSYFSSITMLSGYVSSPSSNTATTAAPDGPKTRSSWPKTCWIVNLPTKSPTKSGLPM